MRMMESSRKPSKTQEKVGSAHGGGHALQDGNKEALNGVAGALVRDRVQNPSTSSQKWQKDNPCPRSTRTLVQSGACERSGSIGTQCTVLKTNLQGQRWTSTICRSPTIDTLTTSTRTFDRNCYFLRTRSEDQRIDLGIVDVNNDESISSSWAQLQ